MTISLIALNYAIVGYLFGLMTPEIKRMIAARSVRKDVEKYYG